MGFILAIPASIVKLEVTNGSYSVSSVDKKPAVSGLWVVD
jgi:hypothetical protein